MSSKDTQVLVVIVAVAVAFGLLVVFADTITAKVAARRAARDRVRPLGFVRRAARFGLWLAGRVVMIPLYAVALGVPVVLAAVWVPLLISAHRHGVTVQDALIHTEAKIARRHVLAEAHFKLDSPAFSRTDQEAAAAKLRALFPDPADYRQVLDWGRRLADGPHWKSGGWFTPDRWRVNRTDARPIDDGVAAYAAWKRLTAAPWVDPARLSDVPSLVPPDRRAGLLAWADAHRERQPSRPPAVEVVRWWVVYETWCPDDESFARRRAEFTAEFGGKAKFGRDPWAEFVAWGEEVAAARRAANPTFPPPEPRAAVVAAVDRLTNADPTFDRVDRLRARVPKVFPRMTNPVEVWCGMAVGSAPLYPNDDVPVLAFSRPWKVGETGMFDIRFFNSAGSTALVTLLMVVWALVCQRGVRLVTAWAAGRWFGVRDEPPFRQYVAVMFNPKWQVLSTPVVLAAGWFVNRRNLEHFPAFYCESELVLLAASCFSGLMGGILVEAIGTVVTAAFVRRGRDPERTVLDNVVTAALGVALLYAYQNSWTSIATGTLIGLSASWVNKLSRR